MTERRLSAGVVINRDGIGKYYQIDSHSNDLMENVHQLVLSEHTIPILYKLCYKILNYPDREWVLVGENDDD